MRLALIGSGGGAREVNSGEGMLAGGGSVAGDRTPAKPPWSEVIVFWGVFLRQSTPLQEETASSDEASAHRKWWWRPRVQLRGENAGRRRMRGGRPNFGEAAVVGGDDLLEDFLRRGSPCPEVIVSSDEAGAHRRTASRRLNQLRGVNAGRRRMHCGRLNFGEAAVVGGDDFFGCSPPAEDPLTGGNCQLR